MEVFTSVEIPIDWYPQHSKRTSKNQREHQRGIVTEMLSEGSPFDDPAPEIVFQGKHFAFTETFAYGTRDECVAIAAQLACSVDDPVKGTTDYFVIGSKTKNRITNKIVSAMIRRMDTGKPKIISESDWIRAIQFTQTRKSSPSPASR
jgi:NAD-dependent DNA ligase